MYSLDQLQTHAWFQRLPHPQKELLQQSLFLIKDIEEHDKHYFDYSFVVMPAAKAYEGFVKDTIFALGLISRKRYEGKRFRVGKALNPEVARQHPDGHDILYDDLSQLCSVTLADRLWQAWKLCRNEVFHYFLKLDQAISLPQAREKLERILTTMELTTLECATTFRSATTNPQ